MSDVCTCGTDIRCEKHPAALAPGVHQAVAQSVQVLDSGVTSDLEVGDRTVAVALPRTDGGTIDNCALANGDTEQNCQMCLRSCPDRERFGLPRDHTVPRPEVQALIDRGNVTTVEIDALRCNSWEWEALIPALDEAAFTRFLEHAIANCGHARRPAFTYNDAVIAVFAPELLKRFREQALDIQALSDRLEDEGFSVKRILCARKDRP